MNKIGTVFKNIREWQDYSQQQVIEMVNSEVNQSSLSAFEKNRQNISKEKLKIIAQALNINPDYVDDQNQKLFKSNDLIKLFLTEKTITGDPLGPLSFLILHSTRLELLSLICEPDIITRIRHLSPFINPVYSVAVKDQDNNLYIVRCKSKIDVITLEKTLLQSLEFFIRIEAFRYKKVFLFAEQKVSSDVYEKLKNWTIEKQDVEALFEESKHNFKSYLIPTDEETQMLDQFRKNNQRTDEIISSLKEYDSIKSIFIPSKDWLETCKYFHEKGVSPSDLINTYNLNTLSSKGDRNESRRN